MCEHTYRLSIETINNELIIEKVFTFSLFYLVCN